MAKLELKVNDTHCLGVEVKKSDEYTGDVFVKFTRDYFNGTSLQCSDMFMSPVQLELLGKYLIRKSQELSNQHKNPSSLLADTKRGIEP